MARVSIQDSWARVFIESLIQIGLLGFVCGIEH